MAIKITEDGNVNYENEPNIERELFPNIPSAGDAVIRAENAAAAAEDAKDAAEAAAQQAMTDTPEGYADFVDSIAPAYSSSATYEADDYVLYNSKLYKANQGIDTAEAWTSDHWTFVRAMDEVSDLKAYLNTVTPEMFGAVGNGIADDTKPIQDALDFGCGIVLFGRNKTYKLTMPQSTKFLSVKSNTAVDLNWSAIKIAPTESGSYSIFDLTEVDNVVIKNGVIIGDKDEHIGSSGEQGHCITISQSSNITLENLYVSKGWGDGVYVGSSNVKPSDNIIINHCTITHNSRNNISLVSGTRCYVLNSYIGYAARTAPKSGIDVEPNDNNVDFCECFINGCTFEGNPTSLEIALYASKASKVYVENCQCDAPVKVECRTQNHVVNIQNLVTDCNELFPFVVNSNRSYVTLKSITWFINSSVSNLTLLQLLNDVYNLSVSCDVYSSGDNLFKNSYTSSGTGSKVNNTIECRCHMTSSLGERINESKSVEKNEVMFDTPLIITSAATLPSYGGNFIIEGFTTATTLPIRNSYAQKGVKYYIWNKSSVFVNFGNIARVDPNHYSIFEAIDMGKVIRVADYNVE